MKLTDEQKSKIFETLGTASMAWSETPKGIFDSSLCTKIGNELVEFLESPQPSAPSVSFIKMLECVIDKARSYTDGWNYTTEEIIEWAQKNIQSTPSVSAEEIMDLGINHSKSVYPKMPFDTDAHAEYIQKVSMCSYITGFHKAMQEYAQAQQGKGWIRVEDGLPTAPQEVNIYFKNSAGFHSSCAYWDGENFVELCERCGFIEPYGHSEPVTHWMPLPTPPNQ